MYKAKRTQSCKKKQRDRSKKEQQNIKNDAAKETLYETMNVQQ